MNQEAPKNPKVFISYSWSSEEHMEWVLQLATELGENGVDVIIDKWLLREGDDKYAFMEKMVKDESIRKVIIICDRQYAEKADGREGGVGTETQIITAELYNKVEQTKFVAVTTELDEGDKPCLPTFLKGRIYIDMSSSDSRAKNLEELLRWIYDKPLHRKPKLGHPPDYLFQDKKSLGTTSRYRQAMEALKQGKSTAQGVCQEYFDTFSQNLEEFRIKREDNKEFDDQVAESIQEFLPYRDEVIDIFIAIARYCYNSDMCSVVHRFLEQILPYGFRTKELTSSEWDFDNFKFILSELFIYAIASFIKHERFDAVNELIEQGYYFKADSYDAPEGRMASYTWFNFYPSSLAHRNNRLNLNRLDLMADIHKERATRKDLPFVDVMQVEFVLFLRSVLRQGEEGIFHSRWFPHSLLYASLRTSINVSFEVFARAQSKRYFDRMKIVLGVNSREELIELMGEYLKLHRSELPHRGNPVALMNIDKLATRP